MYLLDVSGYFFRAELRIESLSETLVWEKCSGYTLLRAQSVVKFSSNAKFLSQFHLMFIQNHKLRHIFAYLGALGQRRMHSSWGRFKLRIPFWYAIFPGQIMQPLCHCRCHPYGWEDWVHCADVLELNVLRQEGWSLFDSQLRAALLNVQLRQGLRLTLLMAVRCQHLFLSWSHQSMIWSHSF